MDNVLHVEPAALIGEPTNGVRDERIESALDQPHAGPGSNSLGFLDPGRRHGRNRPGAASGVVTTAYATSLSRWPCARA